MNEAMITIENVEEISDIVYVKLSYIASYVAPDS